MSDETHKELHSDERTLAGDARPEDRGAVPPGEEFAFASPGDTTEPFEPIDRVEFRRGLNDVHRGVSASHLCIERTVGGLTEALGWSAVVIGLWLALIGYGLAKGTLRGLR